MAQSNRLEDAISYKLLFFIGDYLELKPLNGDLLSMHFVFELPVILGVRFELSCGCLVDIDECSWLIVLHGEMEITYIWVYSDLEQGVRVSRVA